MDFIENENKNLNSEIKQIPPSDISSPQEVTRQDIPGEPKEPENMNDSNHSENNNSNENSHSQENNETSELNAAIGSQEAIMNDSAVKSGKNRKKGNFFTCANCLEEFSKLKMVKCYICKQLTCKACESIGAPLSKRNDHTSFICKGCFENKNEKYR
jgi:predicted RNA-binding Zn-ribbon protein involved in translation (DUF1610 family)